MKPGGETPSGKAVEHGFRADPVDHAIADEEHGEQPGQPHAPMKSQKHHHSFF
jgi:hypothetical protein